MKHRSRPSGSPKKLHFKSSFLSILIKWSSFLLVNGLHLYCSFMHLYGTFMFDLCVPVLLSCDPATLVCLSVCLSVLTVALQTRVLPAHAVPARQATAWAAAWSARPSCSWSTTTRSRKTKRTLQGATVPRWVRLSVHLLSATAKCVAVGSWLTPGPDSAPLGRLQASLLLCTADRPGHHTGDGQAAHTQRNLQSHHKELPLLPYSRQGLAGKAPPILGSSVAAFPLSLWLRKT